MERKIQNEEDKVWVTLERTINLGNYENIKISAGLSQTVTNKNKISSALDVCCDIVWEILVEKSDEYTQQLVPKPKKKFKKEYRGDAGDIEH